MKFIKKEAKNEPREAIEKRNTPGSTFDDLPKPPLREALLKEQGFICAYCMQRVKNAGNSTKIEHWSPRTKENEKDYMNLLAVCKGNEGMTGHEHCDTLKKNQAIIVCPFDKRCEQLVRFDPGGNVYSGDAIIEVELNEILGLNRQHLVDERRKLLDVVRNEIQTAAKSHPDNKIKKADLNSMLRKWQTPNHGKFEPFCQVAIEYLQKKFRRL